MNGGGGGNGGGGNQVSISLKVDWPKKELREVFVRLVLGEFVAHIPNLFDHDWNVVSDKKQIIVVP